MAIKKKIISIFFDSDGMEKKLEIMMANLNFSLLKNGKKTTQKKYKNIIFIKSKNKTQI
jgi:hypothetical protein